MNQLGRRVASIACGLSYFAIEGVNVLLGSAYKFCHVSGYSIGSLRKCRGVEAREKELHEPPSSCDQ